MGSASRHRRAAAVWLLLILAAAGTSGTEALRFPALTGRVVDAAGILDDTTEAALTRTLAGYQKASGGTQVVVVTVPSLQGRAIETFGYQLGRHWGIGQKGEDNGALLIVAPEERQVRIEVGYGLEGRLTDAVSWDIIQGRILPRFRDGDFDGGVTAGVDGVLAALGGDYQPTTSREDRSDRRRKPAIAFWIVMGIILLSSFGRGRRGRLGRALLLGAVVGGLGRGGRGGGGFGGGGFGGGGGSFGGGGASGGW